MDFDLHILIIAFAAGLVFFGGLAFAKYSRGLKMLHEELFQLRREKLLLRQTIEHIRQEMLPLSKTPDDSASFRIWEFIDHVTDLALTETSTATHPAFTPGVGLAPELQNK